MAYTASSQWSWGPKLEVVGVLQADTHQLVDRTQKMALQDI